MQSAAADPKAFWSGIGSLGAEDRFQRLRPLQSPNLLEDGVRLLGAVGGGGFARGLAQ